MTYIAFIISTLLVTTLVYIFNRYVLKNKSLTARILWSVCLLSGIFLICIAVIALIWYNSTDPRQKAQEEWSNHKHLILVNNSMPGLRCIVTYGQKNPAGTHPVNDTLLLGYGKDDPYEVYLPISVDDSTSFPDNFHLKFQDSLQRTVAEYDKNRFFKECIVAPAAFKNKMNAVNWTLVIAVNGKKK